GSFRQNMWKPSWTKETPFETTPRTGDLNNVYEWTLGGPVVKDRLWFFHAGRYQSTSSPNRFAATNIDYSTDTDNKRYEIKGTGTLATNQTLFASYLRNNTEQTQPTLGAAIDPNTIVHRELPNDLVVAGWRGVISQSLFGTFQFSNRDFGFRNTG